MPRPDDPQSFNRYSYARHSPLVCIDPSGHADKSPCEENPSLPFCFPSAPPIANEAHLGQQLSVQQQPVMLSHGQAVTIYEAKGDGGHQSRGRGGIGGLIGSLLRLLGGGGGAGAGKVAQELSKDGDPTNELAAVTRQIRQLETGIRSLQNRVAEHQAKLDSYIKNPDAYDNKGFLKNAKTPEIRERIISGRIKELQREISKFQNEIAKKQAQVDALRRRLDER